MIEPQVKCRGIQQMAGKHALVGRCCRKDGVYMSEFVDREVIQNGRRVVVYVSAQRAFTMQRRKYRILRERAQSACFAISRGSVADLFISQVGLFLGDVHRSRSI